MSSVTVAAIASQNQVAIRHAQTMHGDLDRAGACAQPVGQLGLRNSPRVIGQNGFESIEHGAAAGIAILPAEPGEEPVQKRDRPVALEEPLRGQAVSRLAEVASFGVAGVDRKGRDSAAAFLARSCSRR